MKTKNRAAVALGRKGGKAAAAKMTSEQLSLKMTKAAQARWKKLEKHTKQLESSMDKLLKLNRANTRKLIRRNAAKIKELLELNKKLEKGLARRKAEF